MRFRPTKRKAFFRAVRKSCVRAIVGPPNSFVADSITLRAKGDVALDPGLAGDKRKPSGPERTLEVACSNCGAKFVAYYGYDEENVEAVEFRACGLCHSDESSETTSRGATIRLIAEVMAGR